jgi:hypothetical protein
MARAPLVPALRLVVRAGQSAGIEYSASRTIEASVSKQHATVARVVPASYPVRVARLSGIPSARLLSGQIVHRPPYRVGGLVDCPLSVHCGLVVD